MLALKSDVGVTLNTAAIRQSHQRMTRISVLDSAYNAVAGLTITGDAGYALSGAVSQDASRAVRRTLHLAIANPAALWTPAGIGSAFYWDRQIRVERGVMAGGIPYYAPLGIFQIDTPEVSGTVLTISGADRMDRALKSKFSAPAHVSSGVRVGTMIKSGLTPAVGTERWSVDDGGAAFAAPRDWEPDDERLSAMLSLATDFGLEIYADANAYIVVQPVANPAVLPVVWEFREGEDSIVLGVSKSWSRDRFYNHIVVVGEGANQAIVRAEASDTNPASPTRVAGPMGDRLYTYKSAMITTTPQAQSVANAMLLEHALIEESLRVEHVPHPGLEVNDVVRITHANSLTNDTYQIDSITTPLAGGSATLEVHKTRVVTSR